MGGVLMNPWLCNLLFNNSGGSSLPVTGQTFYASLKTSLVPEVGTGGPTWSRATTAWRFNEIGLLRQIPNGCAEFGGARLVTNLCPTPSNTLAVAGTKTVTLTAAATLQFSMGAGTGTATFSGTGGATGTLDAGVSRVSVNKTVTAGTFIVTASVADLVDLSIVDVTGRDASYVPEYVSVGVLSSPYHGAGADGSKYFATDWQGAPITVANLARLRKESSATNALLWSRDLSNAAWSTKTNITVAKTATGLDGIANTATTLTATATNAIILQPTSGIASAARCASAYVKRVAGTGTILFTQDGGSTWTDITSQINISTWSRVQITATLANPSVGFKISTSGDVIAVDCVQNEAGAVATSPIVTTTTTVARNTDAVNYPTSGNIDFTMGTCYALLKSSGSLLTRFGVSVGADGYSYINSAGANTSWGSYDGTNILVKTGLDDMTAGPMVKRAVAWGGSTQKVTGNGATPVSGAFDGSWGSGATINIASTLLGNIGDIAIYNYKMTDAELQAITT